MPLETLELPRDMVAAARSYAAREHTSIVDLFANALKTTYGIDCVCVLNGNTKPVRRTHAIPQGIVDELFGSLRLPPELEGKTDDELKDAYFAERYGEFL